MGFGAVSIRAFVANAALFGGYEQAKALLGRWGCPGRRVRRRVTRKERAGSLLLPTGEGAVASRRCI